MRWKPHVRFGGRAEESEQPKGRNRASARSNHTHATLLLKAGVPPKVVSERLGHATVAFTMEIYAHVIPGMQAEAAQLFHDLVFGDNEPDSDAPDNGDKEAAGGGNDDTGADLEEPGDG